MDAVEASAAMQNQHAHLCCLYSFYSKPPAVIVPLPAYWGILVRLQVSPHSKTMLLTPLQMIS